MNRTGLINYVSAYSMCSKEKAKEWVDDIILSMAENIVRTGELKLPHFGTFRVRTRRAYKGRNPKTRAVVDVPTVVMVAFRPSEELKTRLKTKYAETLISSSTVSESSSSPRPVDDASG